MGVRRARGARAEALPWGDEPVPGGVHRCNVWQGAFPATNTLEDGFYGAAPTRTYAPNGYGLYNMVGNAWEWCADWWTRGARLPSDRTHRVMRGGSYLCTPPTVPLPRVGARRQHPRQLHGQPRFPDGARRVRMPARARGQAE